MLRITISKHRLIRISTGRVYKKHEVKRNDATAMNVATNEVFIEGILWKRNTLLVAEYVNLSTLIWVGFLGFCFLCKITTCIKLVIKIKILATPFSLL